MESLKIKFKAKKMRCLISVYKYSVLKNECFKFKVRQQIYFHTAWSDHGHLRMCGEENIYLIFYSLSLVCRDLWVTQTVDKRSEI